MSAFFGAVIAVAFIILIGSVARHKLSLDVQTISQLIVYILAPALVGDSLYRTTLSASSTRLILIAFVVSSLLLYLAVLAIGKLLSLPVSIQKSLLATTLFPNNGNLGLSLISFALGSAGLERAIIYLIGSSILMFGIGPVLLKGKGITSSLRFTLRLPLFWAIIAGLSLRIFSLKLPLGVVESIKQLGIASIPLGLLVLGMQLAETRLQVGINEIIATALRLLLSPLISYALGIYLNLDTLDLQVLVLQSAMPTAVNSVVLVTEFGGDPHHAARTVVFSTVMSFLTIPLLISIFD